MQDHTKTEFTKGIRLTQEDYDFINAHKRKKSAAGFLKYIIGEFKKHESKLRKI